MPVCVSPGRMNQCAISSTSVISKGVSQLIKMGTLSSLRAHQITQRPFIALLFVITPSLIAMAQPLFGHRTLCPCQKEDNSEKEKKPTTITLALLGGA